MKKLFRSKSKRIFAGVCGGISDYTNINKNFIRLMFLILFIYMGFSMGICIYVAAYILIPEEGQKNLIAQSIDEFKSFYQYIKNVNKEQQGANK